MESGKSNEKQDLGHRNVVLAKDASDTMNCEEVKHINNAEIKEEIFSNFSVFTVPHLAMH